MQQYLKLLQNILENGDDRNDRTGVGTRAIFGYQMRFKLNNGKTFPLLTTKKLHLKSIIYELLWFLRGDTNVKFLQENGVKIWNEWADENGNLGDVYGKQWRSWLAPDGRKIDQISNLIVSLQQNPSSRRHLVSAWNPADVDKMALPPCHCMFQFFVRDGKFLSCQLYQRGGDIFLGVPFNIASYALLTMMVARVCGYIADEFIHCLGDVHLYKNHFDQAKEQLQRCPRVLPEMNILNIPKSIFDFKYEDFEISNYNPYPHIPAPVAI